MRALCAATNGTSAITNKEHNDHHANLFTRDIKTSRLFRIRTCRTCRVVRGDALLELPASVLFHQFVVIAARLGDRGALLTGDDEGPARPGGGGVALDGDHEVREQVIVLRGVL